MNNEKNSSKKNKKTPKVLASSNFVHPVGKACELDSKKICDDCGECDVCDLDPTKICNNCGACLDFFNTDKEGFVKIPVKFKKETNMTLDEIYKSYGLDDDEN